MLIFYDKLGLSQSEATNFVAYNNYCNLLLIKRFMKQDPDSICQRSYIRVIRLLDVKSELILI